jgi:hypothetical protein
VYHYDVGVRRSIYDGEPDGVYHKSPVVRRHAPQNQLTFIIVIIKNNLAGFPIHYYGYSRIRFADNMAEIQRLSNG